MKQAPAGPSGWERFVIGLKKWFGMKVVLCDSCKWNWRGACHRPERPNATWCPEYTKKY